MGVEVVVGVGGSGVGVSEGLPIAGMLQALIAAIPTSNNASSNVRGRSRYLGMAYRESVGQPVSRGNVPKVAYIKEAKSHPATKATLSDIAFLTGSFSDRF